jgi:uncharacterized Zn-binding protein involved in type VI secretion
MTLAEDSDDTFDLDGLCCARKGSPMSKTPLLAAAASAALFALSACQQSAPEVVNGYDQQAAALQNAAPVQLPPAVTASKTYRCSDNSLVYVDFYDNNTAIIRRGSRDAAPTTLTAEGGNPPFTSGSDSVSGNGNQVTINGKSCHT